jgi:CHRD domain
MLLRILVIASSTALLGAHAPRVPTQYYTVMEPGQETPPTGEKSKGSATFMLSGTTLMYAVEVKGLTGAATVAHIHVGAKGTPGTPVYTIAVLPGVTTGSVAKGTIDLSKPVSPGVSGDSLMVLFNNGHAYVNVHTAAHPGGEIRGQIAKK